MALYIVSEQFCFREVRQSVAPGGTVELPDHVAAQYKVTHPGLIKPVSLNTQGGPKAIRSQEVEPKAGKQAKTRKTAK